MYPLNPPKFRESPELLKVPTIRCECSPDCKMQIGAKQHYITVQQRGGAAKNVAVEHLPRFSDAEHHPELAEAAAGVATMRGRTRPPKGGGTPMPPAGGDDDDGRSNPGK
jgi:hypothetical protein